MKRLIKNQKGFTLIEVLIGIAIIGIIASTFLFAVATAGKANIISDERATAESLARSQFEYIKQQQYEEAADDGEVIYAKLVDIPEHYEIWSYNREGTIETIVVDIIGVPWDSQYDPENPSGTPAYTDVGLQKIFLVIKHNGKVVSR